MKGWIRCWTPSLCMTYLNFLLCHYHFLAFYVMHHFFSETNVMHHNILIKSPFPWCHKLPVPRSYIVMCVGLGLITIFHLPSVVGHLKFSLSPLLLLKESMDTKVYASMVKLRAEWKIGLCDNGQLCRIHLLKDTWKTSICQT